MEIAIEEKVGAVISRVNQRSIFYLDFRNAWRRARANVFDIDGLACEVAQGRRHLLAQTLS